MSSYLKTDESRGIGFELTRQLAAHSSSEVYKIFAKIQGGISLQEAAFKSPNRIVSIKLDFDSEISIKNVVAQVETQLDEKGQWTLINNARIYSWNSVNNPILNLAHPNSREENLREDLTTNVLDVHWLTRSFLPLHRMGNVKKLVNV
ncbi:hypothetical protein BTUL_0059g00210 [Botrytis tulipae]|uniref:Ketoreductase (KR) domain-containing protein n=1 Tax=Botrytis tulipae TaxID=87230 RepID=A0A4Z1ENW9_9HELO|nr:hypothetical protein BTUL_0059g00210 [Botrytis tulipae]